MFGLDVLVDRRDILCWANVLTVGALYISVCRANVSEPLLVHVDFLGGAADASIFSPGAKK
jgi:hypothetical protein